MDYYSVLEALPTSDSLECPLRLPTWVFRCLGHPPTYLALDKDSEAFIEPKVLKVLVGHQVASPRVSNLVGYHIS